MSAWGWHLAFEITKVIVSGSITKDGLSKSEVVPCGASSLRDGSMVNVLECKGDLRIFMKLCFQKVWGEYWRCSDAGRKAMEGQMKERRSIGHGRKHAYCFEQGRCTLPIKVVG